MAKTKKMRAVYLLLALMLVYISLFVFVCCKVNDKTNSIKAIDEYISSLDSNNFTADNWTKIHSIVDEAKRNINEANTKSQMSLITCNAKVAIDGVQPKKSDSIKNGVYFLTDLSWEKLVRNYASDLDIDDNQIEELLQENYDSNLVVGVGNREQYNVIILDNQIVMSNSRSFCYQIYQDNNIYKGVVGNLSISFWILNDNLYIRNANKIETYKLNDKYVLSDEQTIQLDAPTDVNVLASDERLDIMLNWEYKHSYGTLGACVELKNSKNKDFEIINYEVVWMNQFTVQLDNTNLLQGENLVRIYHVGGPILRKGNLIQLTKNSDYIIYRITVNGDILHIEQIL